MALHHDKVLIIVPSRLLLEQFASDFPNFCEVGTGYNHQINKRAAGFIAVSNSVHLLKDLRFGAIFVDEAHHPLPQGVPQGKDIYFFSATHRNATDFKYSMGQAIEDGILCDYDLTVPVITQSHAYACLASLLLRNHGRFRRVLAYCNSVREAKLVRQVLEKFGLAAWHINAATSRSERKAVIQTFSGDMQGLMHVLVTVEVLGEGVNIPNADTCMFVEPRNSFRAIVQAVGRILRQHVCKPLAHIILPAMPLFASAAVPASDASKALLVAPTSESSPTSVCLDTGGEASTSSLATSRGSTVSTQAVPRDLRTANVTAGAAQSRSNACRSYKGTLGGSEAAPTIAWHASLEVSSPAASRKCGPDGGSSSNSSRSFQAHFHPGTRQDDVVKSQKDTDFSRLSAAAEGRLQHAGGMFRKSSVAQRKVVAVHAMLTTGADTVVYQSSSEVTFSSSSWLAVNMASADKSWQSPDLRGNMFGLPARGKESPCTDNFVTGSSFTDSSSSRPALPDQEGIQALHPAPMEGLGFKVARSSLAWTDTSHASQLERFLSAIAQADSRLANSTMSSLRRRLDFVDCRSLQNTGLMAIQSCFDQLLACLQPRGPHDKWEKRLHELEDFVERHGRMPSKRSAEPKEKSLYVWSRDTVDSVRRSGATAAHRRTQLCASSSLLLRRQVLKWLDDPGASFRARCGELKEYLTKYGKLPQRGSDSTSEPANLYHWLRSQKASIHRHAFSPVKERSRREELSRIHALVSEFLCAPLRPPMPIRQDKCLELQGFVSQAGRLPVDTKNNYESKLYQWMHAQRRKLPERQAEDQSLLLHLHPLITEFFRKDPAVRSVATTEAVGQDS